MTDLSDQFSGTTQVSDRHRFEVAPLEAWLRASIPGFAGPITVEQFRGGQSNPTYRLTTPTTRYVIRTKPAPTAKLLPSAHAIDREYRVQMALGGSEVPVARMLALCEDETVLGRAFYVMEHVEGRVLWDQDLPSLARSERGPIYHEMNRVIAALHRVDPASLGLADFGKPGNYFARQIGRWSKQYQASELEPIEAMNRLIEWLPARVPPAEESGLVHGDFRLDNLILHPTEPRVLAVLDWELSTLGHPLADFSYHCMAWHVAPGVFRGIGGLDHEALGLPTEGQYLEQYCRRTGRDVEAVLAHWDFYIAYNMFRIAAILQGVKKRAVEGTASSSQADAAGGRARALADLGWAIAARVPG